MNPRWRKRVSTLIVSAILLSLISFGGIAASPLPKPLDSPFYHSFASSVSQTSNDSTSPPETLVSSKFTNSTNTLASKINSFDAHEQDTVSTATYEMKSEDLNTVSRATYDMKSKDPNTVHVVKELIEKRTRNSKSFLNSDGTTTVQTSVYSLNYFDGQAWQDIDTTIRLDNSDPNYTNSMLANNFKVRLHNKGNNQSVMFSVYDQSVTYRAQGMNNVTGVVYGNTITYLNAWQSTDLEYQVQNDQLKMELHLADSKAPKTFSFELKTKGVKHRINADGSIDFVDGSGKVNFKIPQLWVRDTSSDAERYDRLKVDVKQKGNKSVIEMTLDDKGLQYPIVIDPTTTMNSTTNYGYGYDQSGRMTFVATPSGSIIAFQYDRNGNLISRKKLLTPSVGGSTTLVDISSASYEVYAYGVPKGAVKVQFPTWTSWNGQDDLETPYIQGQKVTDGVWKITIPFSKHNYETGTYYTDVYVEGMFFGGVVMQVKPAAVTMSAPSMVNLSSGSYDITIDGVSDQVTQVLFPTWTDANGQDDLESPWIQGQRVSDRKWKITIPFSKHNYEAGKYITHIYAMDSYGNKINVGVSNTNALASVSAPATVDLSNASYEVYAYGVPKGAVKVQFPTWTSWNGQDDLETPYIQGQKVTDGVWKITIPFSKHNYETGTYYTDVYVDGTFFGGVVMQVSPAAVTMSAPSTVNLSSGSYEITIDGVSDQVTQVLFPTWTDANGQDDLESPWIQGQRVSDRKWKITIPFSKHNYEAGKYITHIYAMDSYGNKINVGVSNTNALASVSAPATVDLSNVSYEIYAYGVPKGAVKVQFPTWTSWNGQDDLETPYIQGQKVTDGVWKITIPFSKHNYETGTYYTDVYVDGMFFGGVVIQVVP